MRVFKFHYFGNLLTNRIVNSEGDGGLCCCCNENETKQG